MFNLGTLNGLSDDTVISKTVYLRGFPPLKYLILIHLNSIRCLIVSTKLVFFYWQSTEMHIYTDFLRLVLEILNAILTYALPRNPEVVYAIMHRQEVFQPFKSHPRFTELLENIYTVLDFFNSRMDAQRVDGEWSVEKVLQVIIVNCRSWRSEGMKRVIQRNSLSHTCGS
ncbi:dymeclin isoform X1 [Morus notabilis]|uniref:dymeclin isoform X1 n=1 Tax=Morus notabilis TaxID=981085 RepID=UPI000CED6048|nr:dymeclin isoform X1 [Morus notabilis]